MKNKGFCLTSQNIRELIEKGSIKTSGDYEKRIQPSSFEPIIGNEGFIIDTEEYLFRPSDRESVYKTLLRLPKKKRRKIDISNGFEIKTGFTYLFPLREKVSNISEIEYISSSPKSSMGRLFLNTRLLTDYNTSFDELRFSPNVKEYDLWVLLQPLAFNKIIYPNMTFSQLRFLEFNSKLNAFEILEEWKKNPLLYKKNDTPIKNPVIGANLNINLDLTGKDTKRIVGLRARKNPDPIDLRKKDYLAEDYFEPLKTLDKEIILKKGEHYLIASSQILKIPKHLNAELGAYSHLGISGVLHRAGFIDNGFSGDLVFEITSHECTNINLHDNMPIGELKIFRTNIPDKLYGKKIGSNYQGQKGPKTSKYFIPLDFGFAAKHYRTLDKDTLVHDKKKILKFRKNKQGFEKLEDIVKKSLFKEINKNSFFHSRYDCEGDDLLLQPIPYIIVFGSDNEVFSYVRADNLKDYGDERLFGKHSIGLGGHIIRKDKPNCIINCIKRELSEEIKPISGSLDYELKFLGTLFKEDKAVDRDHFGLIFGAYIKDGVVLNESSIKTGKMMKIKDILKDTKKYETWSSELIPLLPEFYKEVLE
jgi:deoxycytidine triphosphate deaminase